MQLNSALTRFICDLMRHGGDEVRKRYKAGEYRGINPDHARWYAHNTDRTGS
ncbi:MAG: hypothetical protein RL268_158 [Pseudomonadota bacterium]|jgi:hypothetical protein